MNKKGFVQGFAIIIATLFALVLVIGINKIIFTSMDEQGVFTDAPEAQAIADEFIGSVYPAMDNLFLGVFIASFIFLAGLILALGQTTSRVFFAIAILLVVPIILLISAVFSNMADQIGDNAEFASAEANNGIKQTTIMDNLPLFVFGMISLVLVFSYAIARGSSGR